MAYTNTFSDGTFNARAARFFQPHKARRSGQFRAVAGGQKQMARMFGVTGIVD